MTSKAERKRHKRVAHQRKSQQLAAAEAAEAHRVATRPAPVENEPSSQRNYLGMSDLQEETWRWFSGLRQTADDGGPDGAAASAQLKLARPHLTDDEYNVLSEAARPFIYTARRVGRSQHSTIALHLSGIRKLVMYRHSEGLSETADQSATLTMRRS